MVSSTGPQRLGVSLCMRKLLCLCKPICCKRLQDRILRNVHSTFAGFALFSDTLVHKLRRQYGGISFHVRDDEKQPVRQRALRGRVTAAALLCRVLRHLLLESRLELGAELLLDFGEWILPASLALFAPPASLSSRKTSEALEGSPPPAPMP